MPAQRRSIATPSGHQVREPALEPRSGCGSVGWSLVSDLAVQVQVAPAAEDESPVGRSDASTGSPSARRRRGAMTRVGDRRRAPASARGAVRSAGSSAGQSCGAYGVVREHQGCWRERVRPATSASHTRSRHRAASSRDAPIRTAPRPAARPAAATRADEAHRVELAVVGRRRTPRGSGATACGGTDDCDVGTSSDAKSVLAQRPRSRPAGPRPPRRCARASSSRCACVAAVDPQRAPTSSRTRWWLASADVEDRLGAGPPVHRDLLGVAARPVSRPGSRHCARSRRRRSRRPPATPTRGIALDQRPGEQDAGDPAAHDEHVDVEVTARALAKGSAGTRSTTATMGAPRTAS